MSQARASQWKYFRRLIPLASAIILLACKPQGSEVEVEVELDAGKDFIVTVKNRSDELLVVDDRLLGRGVETPIKVEVADQNGAVIAPCGYLDYVGTGKHLFVAPGGEATVSIPVSAITLTRCLPDDGQYIFRAVLATEGEVISHADWVPFRAASPMTN